MNQVKLTYRIDMYPRQYVMQDWIFKLLLAYHDAISAAPIDHVPLFAMGATLLLPQYYTLDRVSKLGAHLVVYDKVHARIT